MSQSTPARTSAAKEIEYPALYVSASEASKRGKFWHLRLTALELGLVLIGLLVAVVAAVLVQPVPIPVAHQPLVNHADLGLNIAAIAIVGSFLGATLIKLIGRTTTFDEDWFAGRAVAEAVRSEAWRYMVKDDTYRGRDADDRFADKIRALLERTRDIRSGVDHLPARPLQITSSMRQVRNLDLAGRRDAYVTQRLGEQSRWYASKSAGHSFRATVWFWMAIVFQLLAAVSAVFALHLVELETQSQILLRTMSLFGSLAIAFTAWTQLNRDEQLARSYAFSVQELSLVTGDAERAKSDRALAAAVTSGESVIGRENRAWLAKRGEVVESPEFGHSD